MKKITWKIVFALLLALVLSGCGGKAKLESLETEVTAETISDLKAYKSLKELQIVNSDCYDAIEEYISAHPQVSVRYEIAIGDVTAWNTDEELLFETMDQNMVEAFCHYSRYFKNLKSVSVDDLLGPEQIRAVRDACPAVDFSYYADFAGEKVRSDASEIDLSGTPFSEDVLRSAETIAELLPKASAVNLLREDGSCGWSLEELAALRDALPENIQLKCAFTLFGQELSWDQEEIIYEKAGLGNDDLDTVRMALPLLAGCKRFVLDNCGPSYEELSKLRDEFPDKGIVWRVHFYSDILLTDATVLWSVYVRDENCHVLDYCRDLEYIDLGHDEWLTDISFTANMPKLKVFIVGLTAVKDISSLANCPELEYLEIFGTEVKDLSPLASCTKLEHLNISLIPAKDISPLYGLTELKRLWGINDYYIPYAQKEEIVQRLPDCEIVFREGDDLTAFGWRTLSDGSYAERYALLREQIGYGNYNSPLDKLDFDKSWQRGYA